MEFLKNFVDWFKEIIDSVISFFDSVVTSLTQLAEYIGYASDTAQKLLDALPPWLKAFGTVTILISILYMILGRTSGGAKSD